MNSFWGTIYDAVKDRRYGMLFFCTFFGLIGLFLLTLIAGTITEVNVLQDHFLEIMMGMAAFVLGLGWHWVRRAKKQRRERLRFAALSRDELDKARSKLTRRRSK